MATTAQSGNYLTGSTWVGGVVPANTEQIVVSAGHVLTYDGGTRTVGNDTATAWQINGTLAFSRSVASDLTLRGGMVISSTGLLDMGTVSSPITSVDAVLRINNSATMAAGKWIVNKQTGGRITLVGLQKTERTVTTAALAAGGTSMAVAAATNWRVGDTVLLLPPGSASSVTGAIETRTIAAGYTTGALTVPLSSGSTIARASGTRVYNLSRNVRVVESDPAFPSRVATDTDHGIDGVLLQDCEINLRGGTGASLVTLGSVPIAGGYRTTARRAVFVQSGGAVSGRVSIAHGGQAVSCAFVNFSSNLASFAVSRNGGLMQDCLVASTTGAPADVTGTNNIFPGDAGDMVSCVYVAPNTSANQNLARFLVTGGTFRNLEFLSASSTATAPVVNLYAPGAVFENCDFVVFDSARPLFSTPIPCNGRVTFRNCRLPDLDPVYTFGTLPGFEALFTFCYRRGAPTTIIQEMWVNGGVESQDRTLRKNGTASMRFHQGAVGVPLTYSVTAPIAVGETKTLFVNLRRNGLYGSGGMPSVSMRLPNGASVGTESFPLPPVEAFPPDIPDTWHFESLSITNSTGAATELTVTLTASAFAVDGDAWFDGLPLQPFVQAARWYGQVFDESNIFRRPDSTITLTESQAAAVTGVAINHAAQTITVTAERTAAEIYCYCMLDLVNELDASGNYRTRHITSSDGVSFATTYTVVIGSGGSISGRYSDANGAVVAATVTGIVPGSRILIRRTDTNVTMANAIVAGASYSINVQTATAVPISVDVRKASSAPYYQPWATTGSIDPVGGFTATANQQPD
jgi:hypothetical protein